MKAFLKRFFFLKTEDVIIELLRELAKRTDNKVDDRLVEAVATALRNKSYTTAIKRHGASK